RRGARGQDPVLPAAASRSPWPHRMGTGEVSVRRVRARDAREAAVRVLLPAAPEPAPRRAHRRPNPPVRRAARGTMTSVVAAPVARRAHGLRRALALSSGGAAGARVTGGVGGVLAARVLGPTGRGQLAVLVFVATAASMAASAGIQFWVAREVARCHGVHSVTRVVRIHILVIGVILPVAGLLAMGAIEGLASTGPA